MQTESFFPSPHLTHLIKEFSFISIKPEEVSINDQIVIDDGCYDFVFFKGKDATLRYGQKGMIEIMESVFTIHQLEPPHEMSFDREIQMFVAKVQPWANASFFPASMKPGLVDLKSLYPIEFDLIYNEIFQAITFKQKTSIIEPFLYSLKIEETNSFNTIKAVCGKIYETNGAIKVNELVDIFKMNRQVLNKKFKHHVHYTIKQFIKIVRIISLIKYKLANKEKSLTTVAYHFDYSDQAHFNNDFKKVCGISPSSFFKNLPVFFQRHNK